MIFTQYKKTCEVILDYPTMGGKDKKYDVKKEIRNRLHSNIDVHSIRLIYEFPGDGVKFICKLQSNCENMDFLTKVDMIESSRKLHMKEGN